MALHAVVAAFPVLAPKVDEWRERTCGSKPSHGVPPHVTLLHPAPPDLDAIRDVVAPFAPFDVAFGSFARFPGTLWLAPEPAKPFFALIEALTRRFPDWPPYGGGFDQIVPHLTVAQDDFDAVEAALQPQLPLAARVDRVVVLEKPEPNRWRDVAWFPLEGN